MFRQHTLISHLLLILLFFFCIALEFPGKVPVKTSAAASSETLLFCFHDTGNVVFALSHLIKVLTDHWPIANIVHSLFQLLQEKYPILDPDIKPLFSSAKLQLYFAKWVDSCIYWLVFLQHTLLLQNFLNIYFFVALHLSFQEKHQLKLLQQLLSKHCSVLLSWTWECGFCSIPFN